MESSFKVEVPDIFGIPITDKCHLRCSFCFNNDARFTTSDHMSLADFKRIVDWAVTQGIKYIDLTPTVGEALLMPNLHEYLDYLDASKVESYTLITTLAHKNISAVCNRPKLLLEVSLYGGNREQYKSTTKRDVFELVRKNILTISKNQRLNVLKRFHGDVTDAKLNVIILGMSNIKVKMFSSNRDLAIKFNSEIKKCKFMNEPLLTTRGISLCCIDYDYTQYIIGDIGDDIQEVYADIETTIRSKNLKCSTACGWYQPWVPNSKLCDR